jgi:hypothetical protein
MPVCPYCKNELQTKLSASFIDEVDPKIIEYVQEFINRTSMGQKMGMFGRLSPHIQMLIDNPPIVGIITCATCDTVLNIDTQAFKRD